MESIESRIPPRPGIKIPASFTLAERFIADSIRSPAFALKALIVASRIICQKEIGIGNRILKTSPAAAVKIIPLINPTTLLFGLTRNTFVDLRPNQVN